MKTLLFTLEYPPFKGGVSSYYGNMAKYWPIGEGLLVLDNNRGELIKNSYRPKWLPAYYSLKRKIRRSKVDYVLVGHILPLGTATWLLSKFRPIKYAVVLHGMDFSYAIRNGRKRFLTKRILRRADKIICANSYLAQQVEDFRSTLASKIVVINPGVEAGIPEIEEDKKRGFIDYYKLEGKTVLLSLGRLVERKGVDVVIKALNELNEEQKNNIVYIVAGEGSAEEYLKSLVSDSLKNVVKFVGKISDVEKWAWYSIADIFVMPSRRIKGDYEGFGIVYLEANLSGKPVIAGDSGGVKDAVKDGYNGILVKPEDVGAVRTAITHLMEDRELREELGKQGQLRAISKFNWEGQAEKIFKAIEK